MGPMTLAADTVDWASPLARLTTSGGLGGRPRGGGQRDCCTVVHRGKLRRRTSLRS